MIKVLNGVSPAGKDRAFTFWNNSYNLKHDREVGTTTLRILCNDSETILSKSL